MVVVIEGDSVNSYVFVDQVIEYYVQCGNVVWVLVFNDSCFLVLIRVIDYIDCSY